RAARRERRLVHDPVQPLLEPGRDRARRPLAGRPADRHADRRAAPPRRRRAPGRPRLRGGAALAPRLADAVVGSRPEIHLGSGRTREWSWAARRSRGTKAQHVASVPRPKMSWVARSQSVMWVIVRSEK